MAQAPIRTTIWVTTLPPRGPSHLTFGRRRQEPVGEHAGGGRRVLHAIGLGIDAHQRGGARVRAIRGRMARAHLWSLWPLPALLGFHIFAVYYF